MSISPLEWATSYTTAFECVANDAYRQTKKINKTTIERKQKASAANSIENSVAKILELSMGDKEEKRLEELLPILSKVDEALPIAAPNYERAATEEIIELIQIVDVPEWHMPIPAVESWIHETVRRVSTVFHEGIKVSPSDARRASALIFASMFTIQEIIAGLRPLFSRLSEKARENSLVYGAINSIRTNTQFAFIRTIGEGYANAALNPVDQLDAIVDHHFRLYAFPAVPEYETVKSIIRSIEKHRNAFMEIVAALSKREDLPSLANAFRSFAANVQVDSEWKGNSLLPLGDLGIVILPNTTQEMPIAFFAQANTQGYTLLAPTKNSNTAAPAKRGIGEPFYWDSLNECFLEESGRVFFEPDLDRFDPVPAEDPSAQILHKARIGFTKQLAEYWAQHGDLFTLLEKIQPGLLVQDGDKLWFLCKTQYATEVTEAGKGKTLEGLGDLEARMGITFNGEWSRVLLPSTSKEVVIDAKEGAEDPEFLEKDDWRKLIREKIGERIPSLDWIVKKLSTLGTVVRTPDGKGSHESIFLKRNGTVHRVSTCSSIRTTESLPYKVLYGMLRTLCVNEKEFYQQCLAPLEGETTE